MLASAAAVTAMSASDMAFACDPLANLEVLDTVTECNYLTHILVAYGHRGLDGVLRPLVPIVDMKVSAANGYFLDFDKDIVDTHFRHRDILHPYARFSILFY